jgi:hypothetical protein
MYNCDISPFNCRENENGIGAAGLESVPWYPSFYLKQLRIKVLKWALHMLITRKYSKHCANWMVMHNHIDTDCSPQPATFQDSRFGIKFILSSIIMIIEVGEELFQAMAPLPTTVSTCFVFLFCLHR